MADGDIGRLGILFHRPLFIDDPQNHAVRIDLQLDFIALKFRNILDRQSCSGGHPVQIHGNGVDHIRGQGGEGDFKEHLLQRAGHQFRVFQEDVSETVDLLVGGQGLKAEIHDLFRSECLTHQSN